MATMMIKANARHVIDDTKTYDFIPPFIGDLKVL